MDKNISCRLRHNSADSIILKLQSFQISQKKYASLICIQLCDHCLADSTSGDGTGCDNMTVIIALLNSPIPNQTAAAADGPQASSSS